MSEITIFNWDGADCYRLFTIPKKGGQDVVSCAHRRVVSAI